MCLERTSVTSPTRSSRSLVTFDTTCMRQWRAFEFDSIRFIKFYIPHASIFQYNSTDKRIADQCYDDNH